MAELDRAVAHQVEGRCLVVGVGNGLRRDDGVGPVVAHAAARQIPGLDVIVVHQVLPELAEVLAAHRTVVFVDASLTSPAGDTGVESRRVTPCRPGVGLGHVGAPAQVVGLAAAFGARVPTAWIVTVPVTDLGLGEGLSPGTAARVPEAVQAVSRIAAEGVSRPD